MGCSSLLIRLHKPLTLVFIDFPPSVTKREVSKPSPQAVTGQ